MVKVSFKQQTKVLDAKCKCLPQPKSLFQSPDVINTKSLSVSFQNYFKYIQVSF